MPYLIDGHNLIPKIPGLSLQDIDDEIQLIKVLRNFCRQSGKAADVYFDNAPPGESRIQKHGRVTVHFVSQDRTADSAIQSRLSKLGRSAKNYTVVTSDRAVIAASKDAGATAISSGDFSKYLSIAEQAEENDPGTNPNLSLDEDDINNWMIRFGIEDGDD
jgi:predicted RNA-binding protein with PIN domain